MKHFNTFKSILFLGLVFCLSNAWSQVTTFDYTGTVQTYTVPDGVGELNIVALGAQGGAEGGLGARIEGNFTVTPGEILSIIVGEEGHLQVGGSYQNSSGGGGGSFVYDSSDELFIAAGGGGGKCPYVGADPLHPNCHGLAGENGGESSDGVAAGGTGGNGGTAGLWSGVPCGGGGAGWLSVGGGDLIGGKNSPTWAGGDPYCGGGGGGCGGYGGFGGGGGGGNHYGGGGGGGGYSGGGGGSDPDHGGGGGSFNSGTDQVNEGGVNEGHGQVIITELCEALTVTVSDTEICLGESITLSAEGLGEITWDGGLIDDEPFTPASAGLFTFTATSDDESECNFTVEIEVFELPDVVATADPTEICVGESIILYGGGADDFEWFPEEIEDGVAFTPEAGEYTYTVIGTDDATGCENEAEVDVTVHELPAVVATITDGEICLGESVTLNGEGAITYDWDMEEDGIEFTPTETGTTTYTVIGTDVNGCVNESEIDLTVYEELEIIYTTTDEIFGSDGTIDLTVTGGSTPYLYDWDNDETGDFDDTEDLADLTCGTYVVEVMCDAGCTATATISVSCQVSINENNIHVEVYPNPTNGNVTIAMNGTFNYSVTAIDGSVLMNGFATNKSLIDLSEFANGPYFISVKTDDQTYTTKVIKK